MAGGAGTAPFLMAPYLAALGQDAPAIGLAFTATLTGGAASTAAVATGLPPVPLGCAGSPTGGWSDTILAAPESAAAMEESAGRTCLHRLGIKPSQFSAISAPPNSTWPQPSEAMPHRPRNQA